jgi:hypothetical protein
MVDIEFLRYTDLDYQILDLYGRKWLEGTLRADHRIRDVSGLSSGFYLLSIQHRDEIYTLPFVKQ